MTGMLPSLPRTCEACGNDDAYEDTPFCFACLWDIDTTDPLLLDDNGAPAPRRERGRRK